jgi:hypothetical protein
LGTDERVRGATVVVAAEGVGHVAERQCGQMGNAVKRSSGQAVKRSSGRATSGAPLAGLDG